MPRLHFCAFVIFAFIFWSHSPANALNIRKLPNDVLKLIFDNLRIKDLLHVTESDAAFLQSAIWSFRHSFAHRTVHINGRLFNFGSDEKLLFINDKGEIEVRSYEITLKILNNFATAIEKLELNHQSISADNLAEIQRIVREKHANHLKYFAVTYAESDHHDLIPSVFPNVESVALMLVRFGSDDIRLDVRFPRMRSLDLSYISTKTDDLVDHHFSHLSEFKVHFCDSIYGLKEAQVERMFKKNAQIKDVVVKGPSQNFLKILHENLPLLETLELDDIRAGLFGQSDHVNHFASVKKFTLHMIFNYFADPEHFPFTFGDELEELKLVWFCGEFSPRWIEFIERFKNIPKLSVEFLGKCYQFSQIVDLHLPKLREIRIQSINLRGFHNFFDRLKQRQGLEKVYLIDLQQDEVEHIRDELNADWEMNVCENDLWSGKVDVVLSKTQIE